MKKRGSNYVFAHSQGSHFAYYVVKQLRNDHNVDVKARSLISLVGAHFALQHLQETKGSAVDIAVTARVVGRGLTVRGVKVQPVGLQLLLHQCLLMLVPLKLTYGCCCSS